MKQKSLRRLGVVLMAAALILLSFAVVQAREIPADSGTGPASAAKGAVHSRTATPSDSDPSSDDPAAADDEKDTNFIADASKRDLISAIEKDLVDYEDDLEGADEANLPFDPDAIDLTGADLSKLPCLSLGRASRGRLINGVELTSFPGLHVRTGGNNYSTPEVIAGLRYGVARVREEYPDVPDLIIGDVSKQGGGRLKRHKSHQAGRDVDMSYYLKGGGDQQQQFTPTTPANLDVEKTWALIEAFLEDGKVQYIFMDYRLQRPLYNYLKYVKKAPEEFLEKTLSYPSGPRGHKATICHARGHANHMHVRFYSPIAVAAAQNYNFNSAQLDKLKTIADASGLDGDYIPLASLEKVEWGSPPETEVVKQWKNIRTSYRVRKGETLGAIAKRNGVKAYQIQKWNNLGKAGRLKPGQSLVLYKRELVEVEVPVVMPQGGAAGAETADVDAGSNKNSVALASAGAPADESAGHTEWVTVQKGDTLAKIANRTKTTIEQIRALNNISTKKTLHIGDNLKVRVGTDASSKVADAVAKSDKRGRLSSKGQPDELGDSFHYLISRGDNLSTISRRFGLKVSTLCRWNGIAAASDLKPGATLLLYVPMAEALAAVPGPDEIAQAQPPVSGATSPSALRAR